ncbi:hypothetical protein ACWD4G_02985 [Streptomyces sp. NPDC002643]
MRSFKSKSRTKKYGSALAVASLAFGASATAAGTAQADPDSSRVKLKGTVSCERFEDSNVDSITVTTKGKAKKDNLSGEDVSEAYSLTFTGVTKSTNGQSANAKIVCIDSDEEEHTYSKTFTIKRPTSPNTEVQTRNFK